MPACRRRSTACAGSSFSSSTRCPSPPTDWDESETPPGTVSILLKATGVPIDHYSYEAVELLKDMAARWQSMRRLAAIGGVRDQQGSGDRRRVARAGGRDLCRSTCRSPRSRTRREFEYLNDLPTSLRAARRSGRSPARRRGNDHHGLARVPAAAEGRRGEDRSRTLVRGIDELTGAARGPDGGACRPIAGTRYA